MSMTTVIVQKNGINLIGCFAHDDCFVMAVNDFFIYTFQFYETSS